MEPDYSHDPERGYLSDRDCGPLRYTNIPGRLFIERMHRLGIQDG